MIYTLFPTIDTDVVSLYKKMYMQFSKPRKEKYLSSPLTSGGAIKIPQLPREQVIQLNSKFAEVISLELTEYTKDHLVTLPHMIGKRTRWKELDYMLFWMFYLSGIPVKDAGKFIEYMHDFTAIDTRVFSNYDAVKKDRAHQYQLLLDYFVSFIQRKNISLNLISEVILLPDYKESLGCCFEKKLAVLLHIPIKELYINSSHPRFSSSIAPFAPWIMMRGYDITNEVSLAYRGALILL